MSDNKLVKTITDAAVLTGLDAGIGWIAKKVVKENFTSDPSSNAVMAGSIALRSTARTKNSFQVPCKSILKIVTNIYYTLESMSAVSIILREKDDWFYAFQKQIAAREMSDFVDMAVSTIARVEKNKLR